MYGEDVFAPHKNNPNLREIKGDIRDPAAVKKSLEGCDAVIHLACISNDPSFELNPNLGKSMPISMRSARSCRPRKPPARRAYLCVVIVGLTASRKAWTSLKICRLSH